MNSKKATKKDVIKSFMWRLLERCGVQGTTLLVSIILARILSPEEYGTVSLVMIFIALANVFVQCGFNTALIQKKDSDDVDFSTIFYISFIITIVLYIILYITAPFISVFYNKELTLVIRVLALTLFFGSVNSIQIAVLSKRLAFKNLFFSNLGAAVLSGFLGIIFAYLGAGIWALIIQQLSNQFCATLIMWFTVKWRPKLTFSCKRAKRLFSYGWKILLSNLIETLFLDLRSLIIGKIYAAETLAYFDKGKQFPSAIITNINNSIQSVMLPTYSAEQDNRKRIKEMMRKSVIVSSFIIFPAMVGLATVANSFITIILTDKWLECVPFLQIFCFSYIFTPLHTTNMQGIMALGYSNYILKIELLKKSLELIVLFITLKYGPYAIAVGALIISAISFAINAWPNKKLIDYGFIEQLRDIVPTMIISLVMGGVTYLIGFVHLSLVIVFFLQILGGFFVYLLLAELFKLEAYCYIKETMTSFFKRRRKSK